MKSTMSVQVDTDTLLRLMKQLRNRGGAQDVSALRTSLLNESKIRNR
jgi:hypothetical protein